MSYKTKWLAELYDGGWVGLSWPVEFGGRGLSPLYEAILNEELGAAGVPNAVIVGRFPRSSDPCLWN